MSALETLRLTPRLDTSGTGVYVEDQGCGYITASLPLVPFSLGVQQESM